MKRLAVVLLAIAVLIPLSFAYVWSAEEQNPSGGFANPIGDHEYPSGDYHHPSGYHYYEGSWWLGDEALEGLDLGTVVETLPPDCSTVMVGDVPYYYDGRYYYESAASGFVVVEPPEAPVVTPQVQTM